MPNINEFLNKKIAKDESNIFEDLPGTRPCSSCDLDVDGGLWDPNAFIMKWTCSNGHETIHRVG